MSSYKYYLPNVFPYVITGTLDEINKLVGVLQKVNCSFARTVDNQDGTQNLWLSRTSLNYLESAKHQDLFEHVLVITLNATGIVELNGNGE